MNPRGRCNWCGCSGGDHYSMCLLAEQNRPGPYDQFPEDLDLEEPVEYGGAQPGEDLPELNEFEFGCRMIAERQARALRFTCTGEWIRQQIAEKDEEWFADFNAKCNDGLALRDPETC